MTVYLSSPHSRRFELSFNTNVVLFATFEASDATEGDNKDSILLFHFVYLYDAYP